MTSRQELQRFQENVLYGMAKGPWASWWACEQEEKGRSFSGVNIYDACPEPPPKARKWAKKVYAKIADLNNASKRDMLILFLIAQKEGFSKDAEAFGFYLGCEASGMGIRWDDDLSTDLKIVVPQIEFYI